MYKLIKAEFLYSRYLKIAFGPLIGLITYYILFVQLERIHGVIAVLLLILIGSIFAPWKNEKRVRKLSLLPIRPADIAKSRIIIILLPLVLAYLILSISIPVSQSDGTWERSYAELLFLFGLSIIGGSIVFTMDDILSDFRKNERTIFSILIAILGVVLLIMILMICVNSFKANIILGYLVISSLVLIAIAFLYSTIHSFLGRSSYLE